MANCLHWGITQELHSGRITTHLLFLQTGRAFEARGATLLAEAATTLALHDTRHCLKAEILCQELLYGLQLSGRKPTVLTQGLKRPLCRATRALDFSFIPL